MNYAHCGGGSMLILTLYCQDLLSDHWSIWGSCVRVPASVLSFLLLLDFCSSTYTFATMFSVHSSWWLNIVRYKRLFNGSFGASLDCHETVWTTVKWTAQLVSGCSRRTWFPRTDNCATCHSHFIGPRCEPQAQTF